MEMPFLIYGFIILQQLMLQYQHKMLSLKSHVASLNEASLDRTKFKMNPSRYKNFIDKIKKGEAFELAAGGKAVEIK